MAKCKVIATVERAYIKIEGGPLGGYVDRECDWFEFCPESGDSYTIEHLRAIADYMEKLEKQ